MNVFIINPNSSCFRYELESVEDIIGTDYKEVKLQENMIALYPYKDDDNDYLTCRINGIDLYNIVVICGLNDGEKTDLEDKEVLRMKYGTKIEWL